MSHKKKIAIAGLLAGIGLLVIAILRTQTSSLEAPLSQEEQRQKNLEKIRAKITAEKLEEDSKFTRYLIRSRKTN